MNNQDRWSKFFKDVHRQDFPSDGPHGSIQWKGTDVCMDITCKCGEHIHFDGDFLYYWECPYCHAKFALGTTIKFIELTPQQANYVETELNGFKTSPTDEEQDAINIHVATVSPETDAVEITTRRFLGKIHDGPIPHYVWNAKTLSFDKRQ